MTQLKLKQWFVAWRALCSNFIFYTSSFQLSTFNSDSPSNLLSTCSCAVTYYIHNVSINSAIHKWASPLTSEHMDAESFLLAVFIFRGRYSTDKCWEYKWESGSCVWLLTFAEVGPRVKASLHHPDQWDGWGKGGPRETRPCWEPTE